MDPKVKKEGIDLLKVAVKAADLQLKNGGLFIFEHPRDASSWQEKCLTELAEKPGVQTLILDQCMYGLTSQDREGVAPARKSTRILTNVCGAEKFLRTRCDRGHRHVELVNNRAKAAQVYPEPLCMNFLRSLKFALDLNERYDEQVNGINNLCGKLDESRPEDLHIMNPQGVDLYYNDENTGQVLEDNLVKAGDAKEVAKLKGRGVYEYASRSAAREGKLVKTRWVRTKKGAEVRSRFVAQEFAAGDPRDDLFASTPPLFGARLIVSLAATWRNKLWSLMCLDISCAFLYADAVRQIFIELPSSDPRAGDPNVVGRLKKALYGTRDAPQLWQQTLTKVLVKMGFEGSRLQPGVFVHKTREIMMVTHVDDFLIGGPPEDLLWLRAELKKNFEISGVMMDELDVNGKTVDSLKFLGRTIRKTADGYTWEADEKHVRLLLEESEMRDCKPLSTPMCREDADECLRAQGPEPLHMESADASLYRRSVARLNYLALDRPDIAVAVNRLARTMSSPRIGNEVALKRVLRYLQGVPVCRLTFPMQHLSLRLVGLSDSDWAGCKVTRKSTSGNAVLLGAHLIHFSSRTQKAIALSSSEAELVSQVGVACEVMAVQNLLRECHIEMGITCKCDSSAARAIASRVGVGRLKHLELKHLWIQDHVQSGRIEVIWIPRAVNPSDGLTHVSSEFSKHMSNLGLKFCIAQKSVNALSASSEGGVGDRLGGYLVYGTCFLNPSCSFIGVLLLCWLKPNKASCLHSNSSW